MTIQLSPAQQQILSHAAKHTDGKLIWFPETLKGGAKKKVIDSLFSRGLITTDKTDCFITTLGYEALGLPHRGMITPAALDAVTDSAKVEQVSKPKARTRENSKQAQVIAMLKRPEGATIKQICQATEWQSHTVRGSMAGALKKKLGLAITSEKPEGGERVYHIG